MRLAATLLALWLGATAGVAGAQTLPDPDYCARRDADPEKCVIKDGPPPRPIVRKPQKPQISPTPEAPAPGPENPVPKPRGKS